MLDGIHRLRGETLSALAPLVQDGMMALPQGGQIMRWDRYVFSSITLTFDGHAFCALLGTSSDLKDRLSNAFLSMSIFKSFVWLSACMLAYAQLFCPTDFKKFKKYLACLLSSWAKKASSGCTPPFVSLLLRSLRLRSKIGSALKQPRFSLSTKLSFLPVKRRLGF